MIVVQLEHRSEALMMTIFAQSEFFRKRLAESQLVQAGTEERSWNVP